MWECRGVSEAEGVFIVLLKDTFTETNTLVKQQETFLPHDLSFYLFKHFLIGRVFIWDYTMMLCF